MMNKYIFLGNCLKSEDGRKNMIDYIKGRFKPGTEDNFINGLIGEYIAEEYLKCHGYPVIITDKQEYVYSVYDNYQHLDAEPDFRIGKDGYDVKTTRAMHFTTYKYYVERKAKSEGAKYVVLLAGFNYRQRFGDSNTTLSIETVDGKLIHEEVKIPNDFIDSCIKNLEEKGQWLVKTSSR